MYKTQNNTRLAMSGETSEICGYRQNPEQDKMKRKTWQEKDEPQSPGSRGRADGSPEGTNQAKRTRQTQTRGDKETRRKVITRAGKTRN